MEIEKLLDQMTLEEKASLCSGRDFWRTKAIDRLGIPSVMMCDGPHGLRKQLGEGDHLGINESIQTVCYPTASALASSFDRSVLAELGRCLGEECQAEQVGMLLGPGLNIKRSPLCGRNFEYFSEDPYLAGELGSAYITGLQRQGVAACVKHFAANNQETRRMSGTSNLDERTLHEIYLPAFEAAVRKGNAKAIMCAYNAVNGTFCAENQYLLTDVLRRRWGFDGMVVTDWGAVKDRCSGLQAGLDLEMPGGPGNQDARIVEAVRSGKLEEAALDNAVRNVLQFVLDSVEQKRQVRMDRDVFTQVSSKLASQCAVLMKNENALPIDESDTAVFIGAFARTPRYQGAGSSHIHVDHAVGALEAAESMGKKVIFAEGYSLRSDGGEYIEEAKNSAARVGTAVVFAGLPDAFESEGEDRCSMALPDVQNRLIEAVAAVNPRTVVVLHCGAPVEMPWLDKVQGVLCMYLGGQQVGEATVKLLYGMENPSGKLAETWPCRLEDTPSYLNFPGERGTVEYREGIYVGYRYYDKKSMEVLFPFGHGLSYTSFQYRDLTLSSRSITDSDTLTVTCKVKNTGTVTGYEVVQLYVRDEESTVGRPIRELKGFEKPELAPGEEKTVSFSLDKRAFAYYEPKVHDWFVESGNFLIEIGTSSRDIRLCSNVYVCSTDTIPVYYSLDSTLEELGRSRYGATFLQQIMKAAGIGSASDDQVDSHMGEGSANVIHGMLGGMSIRSLITFGVMTYPQAEQFVKELNQSVISCP